MKKFLLITPPCIKLYKGMREAAPIYPPLGLGYIAAVLKKNKVPVKIIDSFASNLDWDQIKKEIIKENPNVLGITCTTTTFSEAVQIAQLTKKYLPKCTIVVGGPHVTAIPKKVLNDHPEIDICAIGEGEYIVLDIAKGKKLEKIKGIAFKKGKKIIITSKRMPIPNIDIIPFPARESLPNQKYQPPAKFPIKKPFTTVISSRGCPFPCIFCSSKVIFGITIRQRSAENVLKEIKEIVKKYRINEITFADDTFPINFGRLKKICLCLKELGITWTCSSRVDIVSEKSIKMMADSGCKLIEYGVESGSPKILRVIKKKITKQQARNAIKWTKKAGIKVSAAFMIGNPGESRDTIKQTVKFAKELDPDMMHLSILTPYPGTEAYEIVKAKGELMKDFEDYSSPKYIAPVIKLGDLEPEDLKKLWKSAMLSFYLRPKPMFRILKDALSSREEFKKFIGGVLAFLYSIMGGKKKED